MNQATGAASGNVFPLSHAQERLWFLDQMAPGNPFYNLQLDMPLYRAVDEAAWQRALDDLVRRHEILRTTFASVDGGPVQVIGAELRFPLTCVDLRAHPAEQREALAAQLAAEQAREPFDLARGPLLRGALARLDDALSVFYLTMHHIVTDGWSMDIVTRELAALYEAHVLGEAPQLPELPIQYADFAIWQRKWLDGDALRTHLAYWTGRLAGLRPLELPCDFARPAMPTWRGGFQSLQVAPALADALQRLCQREKATLFMGLLAAFQVLMMRYSGQEDVAVGSPIANRSHPDVEPLIGFFVNTLVMRTDLSGQPSFREVLGRVRETALGAYAHQDLPFEKLVEALQPERDLSRNPLFQVMFVLQGSVGRRTGGTPQPSYQPAPSQPEAVHYGTAKFDLTLYMTETADGIGGIVEYSTDLFADESIRRMIGHLQMLLQSAVSNPDAPVTRLGMLSAQERHALLVDWNRTATPFPAQRTIAELFEEQARLRGDAVALACGASVLRYGELNARANRLARLLRAQGLAAGQPVGVSLPRGIELVVALLAILKAGGAYLPLDPDYPAARLATLMREAHAPIALTRGDAGASLAAASRRTGCAVIELDRVEAELAALDDGDLEPRAGSDALAYVLFTSGSTGVPKAVPVTHRNVVRLVRDTNYVTIDAADVFLMFAPLQFDASTFEIWGPLLNGARLEICPPGPVAFDALAELVERAGVTILWLTASVFHRVVESHLPRLWGVRQLLAGGDVLSPAHCQRVLDELPGCTLINGYGPTETTTFAACHRMSHGERIAGRVPIGVPVANAELYVLDAGRELAAIGVPGELYIGGEGVAAGYLNDARATAERFVPHPFAPGSSGRRLFRTGDRARFNAQGILEFLGRDDQQVKIRGFRIDPGEIESVLRRHPAVRDACVLAREDGAERRLLGYVAADAGQVSAAELRQFLREALPEHMVPAAIMLLDALPVTANGKLDRVRLPLPGAAEFGDPTRRGEPENDTERLIAGVWQEVLELDAIGRQDNFFDLGGHSLLLVKAHSRLRDLLGESVSIVDLFRFPTIEALAAHLGAPREHAPTAPRAGMRRQIEERAARQQKAASERRKSIQRR